MGEKNESEGSTVEGGDAEVVDFDLEGKLRKTFSLLMFYECNCCSHN